MTVSSNQPAAGPCLVLTPAHASVPPRLLRGLSDRNIPVLTADDPARAMVHLARGRCLALILVDPGQIPRVDELATAVGLYHPKLVRWTYQEEDAQPHDGHKASASGHRQQPQTSRPPRLVPWDNEPAGAGVVNGADGEDPAASSPANPLDPTENPSPDEPLSVSWGQEKSVRENHGHPEGVDSSGDDEDPPLVTEQELAMLLGNPRAEG